MSAAWEFESKGGFANFAGDCQGDLEAKYQAFLAGHGTPCVTVDIGGAQVTVDFNRMTQKAWGGRVRKLRRRETDME